MKKRLITYLALFTYIVFGIGFSTTAFADESNKTADQQAAELGLGFTYKVVKPENQRSSVGYFDLRMNAGQKQTVEIELANGSDEEITIGVSLNGAKTNGNGVIEYGPSAIEKDKSLKYDFVDIVTGPKEVVLPPKTMIPLKLEIAMPASDIDGVISGGIQLKQQTKEEKDEKEKTGITNEYAYLVGMLLSENDTVVTPNLELNKVYAGLANYRNAVFVNFSNVQPAYLENMTVDVQIMKKGSEEVLYDTKKAGMRMAPNSLIDFPVEMNGDRMEAGDYKAHILVTADDKKWEWTEEFTITDEEADKFNGQDVSLTQERGIDWKLIAMIVGGIIAVVVIIFFIVRSVQQKKMKNRKKKGNRKKTAAK
ncbi:DUF916 and DUF3324 domain-containing protein [Enterococcus termitis]|jgi:hypothetical protein|uniref:Uncharacterized protein n=1 Tax=Enterococcus termitis TaxID=332950 RepID=A0A1E5H487_9ENTE|nr:DUF916 and DUF3324 domain-containing protein [Enterococcus termitis]OEG19733.1 hypothetical protein BCR25_14900 [Enterococcus termitis]OJG96778.1 hypothetical protein RV18_GL001913 [Enterococcus termitis]